MRLSSTQLSRNRPSLRRPVVVPPDWHEQPRDEPHDGFPDARVRQLWFCSQGAPDVIEQGRPGVTKVKDSLAEEPVARPILNAPSFASGSIVKATTLADHHAAIDS